MKINISILTSSEIMLQKIIPSEYWSLINENQFFISNPNSKSDWINIEKVKRDIAVLDYSDIELDLIYQQVGEDFFSILVTLKREFANLIFDKVIDRLKTINNRIMIVAYSNPLKILNFNEYLILYKKGLGLSQ